MEINDNNMRKLAIYIDMTLSPDQKTRRTAEEFLKSVETTKNYPILLLNLVNKSDYQMTTRIAGTVAFKNFIKQNWQLPDDQSSQRIHPEDRDAIKQVIVDVMLGAPNLLQKQLSDAISIIGKHDFPEKWPTLLTGMVDKFATGDFNVINGVLVTAHSIFKRYRHEFKSNELWIEIKFVLDTFAKPLTDLFLATINLASQHSNNPEALKVIYSSLLLISKIFYSLNTQDLPEFFEDNMNIWMPNFNNLLKTDIKCLESTSDEEPGLIENLKSQICFNVSLYAQMYDEEFSPFLPNFVTDIWNLLVTTDLRPKYDLLVSHALQFLQIIAGRIQYKQLFEDVNTLNGICEKVIIPNIEFRDSDLELFEDNPEEYMKRDLEGSDVETRRRAACDLIKVLASNFDQQVTNIFSQYVGAMLQEYSTDPENKWKHKNAAVYLVTSLVGKGSTQKHGVTQISSLVNINDFANQFILPELNKPVEVLPVIKADSIKYMLMFRSVLSPDCLVSSVPIIVKLLQSQSIVVHSYAASAVDKYLSVRTPQNIPIVTAATLSPLAEFLLNNLFHVLTIEGSEENEYVMKAIMHVFASLGETVTPFLANLIPKLAEKLIIVAKNPRKPFFNHYLFETITISINIVCKKNPEAVSSFNDVLNPIFELIIEKEVDDFLPYVLQVISVLLRFHRGTELANSYQALIPGVISADVWDSKNNVAPFAELLRVFISKAPPQLYKTLIKLPAILEICQKLISSRANDHEAFNILQTMLRYTPREEIEPHLKQVLILLLHRVTMIKTQKFVKGMLVFYSFFHIFYGGEYFIKLIDEIQFQMFSMIVEKLYLEYGQKVTGPVNKKVLSVGITKLLCETKPVIDGPYSQLWPSLLKLLISILESTNTVEEEQDPLIQDSILPDSHQPVYSRLVYAEKENMDPVEGITDVKSYFIRALVTLSNSYRGRLSPIISQNLSPEEQSVITSYLQRESLTLS